MLNNSHFLKANIVFYHLLTQLKYRRKCNYTSEIDVLIEYTGIPLLLYSIHQGLEAIRASDMVQSTSPPKDSQNRLHIKNKFGACLWIVGGKSTDTTCKLYIKTSCYKAIVLSTEQKLECLPLYC